MELSVRFEGSQFEGGSIRPTIENSAAATLTRSRVEEVERLIEQVTNV